VTRDDARLRDLYFRFRIAVPAARAAAAGQAWAAALPPDAVAGYVGPEAVALYDRAGARWLSAPLDAFGVGRRHQENDIVVGFVQASDTTQAGAARLKLRQPVDALRRAAADHARSRATAAGRDVRSLARGAVCETRSRDVLAGYIRRLRTALERAGAPIAARRDGIRSEPTAGELCDDVRTCLLRLEELARAPAGGMAEGLRWLYLFADRPPSLTALVGETRR
jgi:hypothetical protein